MAENVRALAQTGLPCIARAHVCQCARAHACPGLQSIVSYSVSYDNKEAGKFLFDKHLYFHSELQAQ